MQEQIEDTFLHVFGRTPLGQRLEDLQKQVLELCRYTDIKHLKDKAGDSLTSLLMLFNEIDLDPDTAINFTLNKIKSRQQYKFLGRKKNIAILGGAFDPPTLGHFKCAQLILNVSKFFDEVWFMPCFSHMYNKKMASTVHRFTMCELMVQNDKRMRVFDFELQNQHAGETYHTIKKLLNSSLVDEYDFSLVIGMDNANTFDKWYNYEELEKLIKMVVVPRKGENINPSVNWYLKQPHIFIQPDKDNEIPQISSTEIRSLLKEVDDRIPFIMLKQNLLPNVLNYITQQHLYI
jgi:nicotinate-nucleotide adenylyltransferase